MRIITILPRETIRFATTCIYKQRNREKETESRARNERPDFVVQRRELNGQCIDALFRFLERNARKACVLGAALLMLDGGDDVVDLRQFARDDEIGQSLAS